MKNSNAGFTLIEILVALFLGTLMLLAIHASVDSAQKSSGKIERRVIAQQDARSALDLMALEISMASYNPNLNKSIWVSAADCASASANQDYRGIQEATANSLALEMDINESSAIGDSENEIIYYNYNTAKQCITRKTNCGIIAQPFLGALNDDLAKKNVLVVNSTVNVPVFRYYDGAGTELASPVIANIPNIRRIEVTLVLDTAYTDPGSLGRKRIIYSTSIIPRNHINVYLYNN